MEVILLKLLNKIGIDPYFKGEINKNEYGRGLDIDSYSNIGSHYYLFYAVINSNIVSLPISLLHNFIIKGKPVIGIKNYYKIATYNDGEDKNWRTVTSLVNVNEKTITQEYDNYFSEAVYINSEIISLSIELSNFPKFNNDDNDSDYNEFIESDFYNYQLVSSDFEGKLKAISNPIKIIYLDSEYIRSERFNNGLIGISDSISKSLLNTNISVISIGNMAYKRYRGIDFTDDNSSEYFDFKTYHQGLKGYNIEGDYKASAQFPLQFHITDEKYQYDFDNWAVTKDNISDFINLMVTNKVTDDLGYGVSQYYNFQFVRRHPKSYDTQSFGYHIIDSNGNLLNITNSEGGYYFTLCGNTVESSDSIYELVFVNIENETFANGELLFRPILIMWKKQENTQGNN